MKWIIKRLLIVAGTLSLICAAAIVFGRLGPPSSKLQTYGIDFCDGEPCYRGLKPGMAWAKARELLPEAVEVLGHLELPSKITGLKDKTVYPEENRAFVKYILIDTTNDDSLPPINAGDVIAQYGPPCRVYLWYIDSIPGYSGNMVLVYPMMAVSLNVTGGDKHHWHDFHLELNSPVETINIASNGEHKSCVATASDDLGPWRGFASFVVYRDRNLRDLGAARPTD